MHYPIFVKKKRKRIGKKRTKVVKHKKTCLQETLQTGKRKEKQMIYDSLF
jgi:hypothetical protein